MGFPPFLPACKPFQPWDPNPIPGSASPAVTHPLHWIPVPPPPALAKFSSSSLNSTGIFWGVPASSHPLGACRSASGCFGGSLLKWCQSGEGTQLPPPFLSPGRMSSPQGHPGGVLARREQSVEQVSEVRGRGGKQVGEAFPACFPGLSQPPSSSVLVSSGCCAAPGGGLLQLHLCASQEPGKAMQEQAVHPGDSDRTKGG